MNEKKIRNIQTFLPIPVYTGNKSNLLHDAAPSSFWQFVTRINSAMATDSNPESLQVNNVQNVSFVNHCTLMNLFKWPCARNTGRSGSGKNQKS